MQTITSVKITLFRVVDLEHMTNSKNGRLFYGCEIDHPSQLQHHCLLPYDILIDMHFDETVEKVNSTAVIRDWFTLLLEVDLRQSDVAPEQLNAIKSWLEESPSGLWRNNVKRMVLAALEDEL